MVSSCTLISSARVSISTFFSSTLSSHSSYHSHPERTSSCAFSSDSVSSSASLSFFTTRACSLRTSASSLTTLASRSLISFPGFVPIQSAMVSPAAFNWSSSSLMRSFNGTVYLSTICVTFCRLRSLITSCSSLALSMHGTQVPFPHKCTFRPPSSSGATAVAIAMFPALGVCGAAGLRTAVARKRAISTFASRSSRLSRVTSSSEVVWPLFADKSWPESLTTSLIWISCASFWPSSTI